MLLLARDDSHLGISDHGQQVDRASDAGVRGDLQ